MAVSRRDALRAGGVLALAGMAGLVGACAAEPAPSAPPTPADLQRIVAAYRELQVGSGRDSAMRTGAVRALDEVALRYDAAMRLGGGSLWPDLPFGPGSTHFPMMYYRLRTMAVSWATPGSVLSTRPDQPQRILAALEALYTNQYNEMTPELGNWYVYEIGVPYWLLQTVVALGDALPEVDRQRMLRPVQRFVADPNRRTVTPAMIETGANRADKALIAVVTGALTGDPARVAAGVAAVTDEAGGGAASLVRKATEGDGFRTDGSFIQHDVVPYPGHYGLVLLTAAAGLLHVTEGTAARVPAAVRDGLYESVTEVFAPFLYGGAMMEPVRGRMVSRQGETGHDVGAQFIASVVLLARTAPEPVRSRFTGLAARWINAETWAPYLKVGDLARFSGGLQPVGVPEVEYAEGLLADRPTPPVATGLHRSFPQMDRMVHTTGRWSASLGLSSTRTCRYEAINGQNLRGWYLGDGVLYLFVPGQQGHYCDAYWPTVDATALPGTTEKVAPPPKLVGNPPPRTTRTFVGGARLDDGYGAYALDFIGQDGTALAKKAWFFTPDSVVCLGAGISERSGSPVRTIVENRNLGEDGRAALVVDGRPAPAELGKVAALPGARWLHLAGVAGYQLAGGQVTVLREDRTGSWRDIDTGANTHGTTTRYTRRYQQIRLEHGAGPAGAGYAYAVLPGATLDQAAAVPTWRVLANTDRCQAVRLGPETVGAVFHAPGSVEGVAVSAPSVVMWGSGTGSGTDMGTGIGTGGPDAPGWTLAVADPTQAGQLVRVTVDRVAQVVRADATVTVVAREPQLVLDVRVAGSLGATHTVVLR